MTRDKCFTKSFNCLLPSPISHATLKPLQISAEKLPSSGHCAKPWAPLGAFNVSVLMLVFFSLALYFSETNKNPSHISRSRLKVTSIQRLS